MSIADTRTTSGDRLRRIAGIGLITLGGLVLLGSATAKFARLPKVVEEFDRLGFDGGKLTLVAVLEVAGAVLFLAPATRPLGLLLVSAYLGGAIATHVQHDDSPLGPALILALIWVGTWLRSPQALQWTKSR
jgi:hypothetical protein